MRKEGERRGFQARIARICKTTVCLEEVIDLTTGSVYRDHCWVNSGKNNRHTAILGTLPVGSVIRFSAEPGNYWHERDRRRKKGICNIRKIRLKGEQDESEAEATN